MSEHGSCFNKALLNTVAGMSTYSTSLFKGWKIGNKDTFKIALD